MKNLKKDNIYLIAEQEVNEYIKYYKNGDITLLALKWFLSEFENTDDLDDYDKIFYQILDEWIWNEEARLSKIN